MCLLSAAEIIMFEGLTCVYKSNVDLFFYVVGSSQENEVGVCYWIVRQIHEQMRDIGRRIYFAFFIWTGGALAGIFN